MSAAPGLPHTPAKAFEARWLAWLVAALVLVDLLVALRALHVLSSGRAPAPHEAATLLGLLLALQVLLVWSALRMQRLYQHYRRLQESYRLELELSQQVMENSAFGLTVMDEHGRFVYVNRAYAELLGRTPAELLGRTPLDFLASEDGADPHKQALWNRRLSGEAISTLFTVLRANGEKVQVRVIGTPRYFAGRIVGNIASVVPEYLSVPGEQRTSVRES